MFSTTAFLRFVAKSGVHATPGRSPLTAASRQCSRRPARHGVNRSTFSSTAFLRLKKSGFDQTHHRGRQRGRFFRAKAQKKIAPDGRPKRDFKLPKRDFNKPKRALIEPQKHRHSIA